MNAETWAALPEPTRRTLIWLANRYAAGFTGEIVLRSLNGSVQEIRPTQVTRPDRLKDWPMFDELDESA